MAMNRTWMLTSLVLGVIFFTIGMTNQANAGISYDEDTDYGYLELLDMSVVENAGGIFRAERLFFNVSRGGPLRINQEIVIFYHGMHEYYLTLLDYSSDGVVRPLVVNEYTSLLDGGLEREYHGTVEGPLGREWVILIITPDRISHETLETLALAPDEIEIGEEVAFVSINDFQVIRGVVNSGTGTNSNPVTQDLPPGIEFIELSDFATYLDYPLNTYQYNPWPYMYLYPVARFRPSAYTERYGPFSRTWYVYPVGNSLTSNFWDYASSGWIDNNIWVIPPGGYWEGNLRMDDQYSDYFLRVLPFLVRNNTSYLNLQVEINGTLVEPGIDITGAIGWGTYWTEDPFAYYNFSRLLHQGDNTVRLYWPTSEQQNIELQMLDLVPIETVVEELSEINVAVEVN